MTDNKNEAEAPMNVFREDLGHSAPWYRPEIGPRLRPSTQSLFKTYCHLLGPKLESHLHSIRDRAWSIRQYPCIGQWGFLEPGIYQSPEYKSVLTRLKNGKSLLDVGCCMALDLRRLAVDGAPTENMHATDIVSDFWEIGYDLFEDHGIMKAQFIKADVLETKSALDSLNGKIDIIYLGSVLHLFSWEQQIQACKRIAQLSRIGTLVLGCQMGHVTAEEVGTIWGDGSTMYSHNVDSFEKMWRQVGEETATNWKVEAKLGSWKTLGLEEEDLTWMRPGDLLLQFSVTRQNYVEKSRD